jgi:hypothetical protein
LAATETTRATAAEALLAPKASPTFTGTAAFTNISVSGTTAFAAGAIAQAAVAGLVSGLALLSPLASPTFTGTATFANISVSGTTSFAAESSDYSEFCPTAAVIGPRCEEGNVRVGFKGSADKRAMMLALSETCKALLAQVVILRLAGTSVDLRLAERSSVIAVTRRDAPYGAREVTAFK